MAYLRRTLAIAVLAPACLAVPAAAQDVRPIVFGAAGFGNVFRVEDRSFGTKLNLAAGGGIEWRRLGLDAELHRTTGLAPRAMACGIVNVPCTGAAREGVLEATMLTANVSYLFGRSRVRPYVIGSVGVLRSKSVNSIAFVRGGEATLSEFGEKDTGLALGIGAGLDVSIAPHVSLRPEFRTYSSTALSRSNLSLHRGSVAVRYRW